MIMQSIVTSFLLGLSASPACLGVCLPVLLPHIGVVGGDRPVQTGFAVSLFFALGRLVVYLTLGITLFAMGASLQDAGLWESLSKNSVLSTVTRLLLASLVMLYGISVVFGWPRLNWCQTFFHGRRQQPVLSVLLGVLAGSVLCPALWLALLYIVRMNWLPAAGLAIVSFWLGSSLIVIAMGISAGVILRHWRNLAQIRGVAGATLIFVGLLYML